MSSGMFSTEWWITAIAAGVGGSVLAAYVVRWLDRGGGSAAKWITTRTSQRRAARTARIAVARTEGLALNRLRMSAIRARLNGMSFLMLGVFFLLLYLIVRLTRIANPELMRGKLHAVIHVVIFLMGAFLVLSGWIGVIGGAAIDGEADDAERP